MPLMVNHCMLGDGDGRCRHGIYYPQVKPMFPQSEAGREHQALALSGPAYNFHHYQFARPLRVNKQ